MDKPNIKGCINRAIEALGYAHVNLCEFDGVDEITEQAISELKAFRDALPKQMMRHEAKDDFEYVTEQHNFLCDAAQLLTEAMERG